MDDTNREQYKLPSFTKPQTEPMDEEINNKLISILVKTFDSEAENIK